MSEGQSGARYVQVILDRVSDALDRPFQYIMPDRLSAQPRIGMQVRVPFRTGESNAFVVDIEGDPLLEKTKPVLSLLETEPELGREMIELSYWLARRFFVRWAEAIHLCLPPARGRVRKKSIELVFPAVEADILLQEAFQLKERAFRQALLLEYLAADERTGVPWPELREKTGARRSSLSSLQEKGLLQVKLVPAERTTSWSAGTISETSAGLFTLTREQAAARQAIAEALKKPSRDILLHGITGSGKTELYLDAVQRVLQQGKQALVLVPEIALTPQMVELLRARFPGQVGMLHSGLTDGERYDQWWKIKERKVNVVLGSRSAVFAPLEALGLVVMDEEHENTYRQDDAPRYHARDVARWRARYHDALFLMGSATPSLETYSQAVRGEIDMLELKARVAGRSLPSVEVVDMREEYRRKRRSVFSERLYRSVQGTLARGEQVILFLNRRGFAGIELCRNCGFVVECPHCSVSMTYHSYPEHLQCHYCTYKRAPYTCCPTCRSRAIGNFGLGTQKLERETREAFPGVGVLRMDSDMTGGRGALERIWRTFKEKKASILIGTQMIAKGHDFHDVTLVGVIAADVNLHLPDFRAGEKTFQLLTQVSGRSGRGEKRGRVIVQTFSPEHYSILAAAAQDYRSFMQEESRRRQLLHYPPYSDLLLFGCSAPLETDALAAADSLRERLEPTLGADEELLGPAPAPVKRVKNLYRYHLLYKSRYLEEKNSFLRAAVWDFRRALAGDVRVTVDFNPLMML